MLITIRLLEYSRQCDTIKTESGTRTHHQQTEVDCRRLVRYTTVVRARSTDEGRSDVIDDVISDVIIVRPFIGGWLFVAIKRSRYRASGWNSDRFPKRIDQD